MEIHQNSKEQRQVSTEKKILEAAQFVFMEKGYDGARMHQIAERAGINKALLHYYFRSKDRLFVAVFDSAVNNLLPSILGIFYSDKSFSEKIRYFFELHFGFLVENPMIPRFIVTEMARHPDKLEVFIKNISELEIYSKFEKILADSIESGEIKAVDPTQLLLNILSLSVFPILAAPMLSGILNISDKKYSEILNQRKKLVADFVIDSLVIK
jgi:AcrR family transcriptional regulator